jgi:hypothetical protein
MPKNHSGRPQKENTDILYIRLPKELTQKVRQDAKINKRPLTATIELIIERHYTEVRA